MYLPALPCFGAARGANNLGDGVGVSTVAADGSNTNTASSEASERSEQLSSSMAEPSAATSLDDDDDVLEGEEDAAASMASTPIVKIAVPSPWDVLCGK